VLNIEAAIDSIGDCIGLTKPDTDLGENTHHEEVSDDQATSFSLELKQQVACLVFDQGYSYTEARRSVCIGV
jgi:hypothetical protein